MQYAAFCRNRFQLHTAYCIPPTTKTMSFLYFLPGHQGPLSLARVEQLGLRYAFEDKPPRSHEVAANGPNGGPGAVAVTRSAFGGDDSKLGYHADRQTWR